MKRRILSVLVILCLIASLLPMSVMAASYPDTDGHWAESSIDRWSEAAVVQGTDGEFRPDLSITRAQIAAIFARLLRLPAASPAEYHDLTADAWYADAVSRCAAAGILTGYPDGTFRPNDPVTREQACAMLARALGISEARRADLSDFPDAAETGNWAKGYVAAMLNRGILTGLSGKLAPKAPVTRAQFVTMLDRAIAIYADEDGMTVKAADMDEDGVIVVVAEDVTIKDAPAGTKVVASAKAKGLKVNGKSIDADQVHTVPETVERPKSAGRGHTHEYKYTDNGDGTHTATCTADDSTLAPEAHTIADGKCTLCGAAQTTESVASVKAADGTVTYFETLAEAVAAATDNATVALLKDMELSADLSIGVKAVLDLNGQTLETNGHEIGITASGDVTVTGSGTVNNKVPADKAGGTTNRYTMLSAAAGGKLTIENGTFTTQAAQIVYTYGDTTILGGSFMNTSTDTSDETDEALNNGALIVVCGTSASLTMTGGTVGTESPYLYGVFVRDGGSAIFGDAETGDGPSIHTHCYAAIGENNTTSPANITIYGGEYSVSTTPLSNAWKPYCATIYAVASGNINIHGGTFTGYYTISDRYKNVDQTVSITGGTFNGAEAALFVDNLSGAGTAGNRVISLTAGTYSTDPSAYVADGYEAAQEDAFWYVRPAGSYIAEITSGDASVKGHKYTSLSAAYAAINAVAETQGASKAYGTVKLLADVTLDQDLTIGTTDALQKLALNGHTLTLKGDHKLLVTGDKMVTIEGSGTIQSESTSADAYIAVVSSGAGLTISGTGASKKITLTGQKGVLTSGGFTVKNAVLNTVSDAVTAAADCTAILTVNSGTSLKSETGSCLVAADGSSANAEVKSGSSMTSEGSADVIRWASSGTLQIKGGTFSGSAILTKTDGAVSISGGTYPIASKDALSTYIAEGYTQQDQASGTTYTVKLPDVAVVTFANGNTKSCTTLSSALSAVNNTTGAKITLVRDITEKASGARMAGGTAELDLAGHTITITGTSSGYPAAITLLRASKLTIEDSSAEQTGELIAADSYCVNVGGTSELTIKSGSFSGSATAVQTQDSGKAYIQGGDFTVSPADTTNDCRYLLNRVDDSSSTIEVTGGTFHDFDPANNLADGENTNFVKEGYQSTESGGIYTVAQA